MGMSIGSPRSKRDCRSSLREIESAIEHDLHQMNLAGDERPEIDQDILASPDPTSKFHHTNIGLGKEEEEEELGVLPCPDINDIECMASPDPCSKYHKTNTVYANAQLCANDSNSSGRASAASTIRATHSSIATASVAVGSAGDRNNGDISSPDPQSKYHASMKNNFMSITTPVSNNTSQRSNSSASNGREKVAVGGQGEDGFGNFSPMPVTPSHLGAVESRDGMGVGVGVGDTDYDGFGNFSPMPCTPNAPGAASEKVPVTPTAVSMALAGFSPMPATPVSPTDHEHMATNGFSPMPNTPKSMGMGESPGMLHVMATPTRHFGKSMSVGVGEVGHSRTDGRSSAGIVNGSLDQNLDVSVFVCALSVNACMYCVCVRLCVCVMSH